MAKWWRRIWRRRRETVYAVGRATVPAALVEPTVIYGMFLLTYGQLRQYRTRRTGR